VENVDGILMLMVEELKLNTGEAMLLVAEDESAVTVMITELERVSVMMISLAEVGKLLSLDQSSEVGIESVIDGENVDATSMELFIPDVKTGELIEELTVEVTTLGHCVNVKLLISELSVDEALDCEGQDMLEVELELA